MIARAGGGTTNPFGDTEALCLAAGPNSGKYTTAGWTCTAFARDTAGKTDSPPNYGEESRAIYEREAAAKHPNGKPMFALDGTMLDENGNRSTFDDVDL
jgi:hypothetical protein